ncbi:MAG: hypothetical protein NUW37_06640 [Planctomycetes bacterium]|nr:hypothetical protein [Planctomycetota bacterium]
MKTIVLTSLHAILIFISVFRSGYCQDENETNNDRWHQVMREYAENLGFDPEPDDECEVTEGIDWSQPAFEELPSNDGPGIDNSVIRLEVNPNIVLTNKLFEGVTVRAIIFNNCLSAWRELAGQSQLSNHAFVTMESLGIDLVGNAVFYHHLPPNQIYIYKVHYAFHNVFLTVYYDVKVDNPLYDADFLVNFIRDIDDYFFRQPLVETLDDSEFAPVINRFELEDNRIHIGERSRIKLEVTNPDSGLTIPEHSLLDAGIGVNWDRVSPRWLFVTHGIDGDPWYSMQRDDVTYGNLFLYPYEEEFRSTARVVNGVPEVETISAEPGTYPLRITVFNERGLTASAELEVVVLPQRERPNTTDDDSGEDRDRGHGNDDDRHDEDNPGQGHGNQGDDDDRGHGNSDDRRDDDNPGQGNGNHDSDDNPGGGTMTMMRKKKMMEIMQEWAKYQKR